MFSTVALAKLGIPKKGTNGLRSKRGDKLALANPAFAISRLFAKVNQLRINNLLQVRFGLQLLALTENPQQIMEHVNRMVAGLRDGTIIIEEFE